LGILAVSAVVQVAPLAVAAELLPEVTADVACLAARKFNKVPTNRTTISSAWKQLERFSHTIMCGRRTSMPVVLLLLPLVLTTTVSMMTMAGSGVGVRLLTLVVCTGCTW
jgi:hypothetical protein